MAIPLFISARKSEFRAGNAGAGNAGDDALRFRPQNSRDDNARKYRVDRLADSEVKDLHSFNFVLLIVFGVRLDNTLHMVNVIKTLTCLVDFNEL